MIRPNPAGRAGFTSLQGQAEKARRRVVVLFENSTI
jgi:hypothetical protein